MKMKFNIIYSATASGAGLGDRINLI